jgi:mitotic spindle assembly checkpoint protein MAD2
VLELWEFKISYEYDEIENAVGTKDLKSIKREIGDVLRQICATISFLPSLGCLCKYTV